MKKETIFAIFLGAAAGVGVAFFMVYKARQNQIQNAKPISTINLTPTIALQNSQLTNLTITEPENIFVTSVKSVTIKGKAAKDSLLVVQSPIKNIAEKIEGENFTVENFPLALGENVIRVAIYPTNPQITSQEKELRIYYIDE